MQNVEVVAKENEKLKAALRQCLKARQINHVKQIIKEVLGNERSN